MRWTLAEFVAHPFRRRGTHEHADFVWLGLADWPDGKGGDFVLAHDTKTPAFAKQRKGWATGAFSRSKKSPGALAWGFPVFAGKP